MRAPRPAWPRRLDVAGLRAGAGRARAALVAVCMAAALAACGPAAAPAPRWPDAPVALRDDADREQAVDALWVLPPGPARAAARAAIADALARRIADALDAERPGDAAGLLDELLALWGPEPAALGAGLAPHARLLERLRRVFARAGTLEPAALALVALAEVAPTDRAAHLAELDELLAFADELAVAANGPHAVRAQPILVLAPAARRLPLAWLLDRYLTLVVERQRVIARLIEDQGASMQVVRAHHDILTTSRRIAGALARAGRVDEIHGWLALLDGIGVDRELAVRAEIVAAQPAPAAYLELARVLRTHDRDPDPAAALAVAVAGLARAPDDVALLVAAAEDARALGRVAQPIALLERALARAPEVDAAVALRLGRLYGARIDRLAAAGRPDAARRAWVEARAFAAARARARPDPVWAQVTAIAQAALGRGLASQGLLAEARAALRGSIARAPSVDALEVLSRIDAQTGDLAAAEAWARQGLTLLGDQTSGDRYRRAKLERLVGDALHARGDRDRARGHHLEAMRAWAALGEDDALPTRALVAERHLEVGRLLWALGEEARAVASVLRAVDVAPAGPGIATGAVAFLVGAGRPRDALEAFHRGLGAPLGDHEKIYMSLWLAAEARRTGAPLDRLAAEHLAAQGGDTWHERLARAATGRLPFEALRAHASTGPRQAELAFYGAALGFHPQARTAAGARRLLEQVVAAGVVLDPAYDLARRHLAAAAPGAR